MYKIFEQSISEDAVAIKSIQVRAEISGKLNLLMNFIGGYDQVSQNIIQTDKSEEDRGNHWYEFNEEFDENSRGLKNFISLHVSGSGKL